MRSSLRNVFFVFVFLLFAACSSEKEKLLTGKWTLASRMIGGAPSSFWFKWNGTVIAPWEKHNFAMISEGTYELVNDRHLIIKMSQGHYKGNIYNFEIIKLTETEQILGSDYEKFRLKKVKE